MSESAASNPVLVEVFRGDLVESRHRGAVAVADADGRLLLALGDVATPIYPRSAVKVLQALPLVESGAADALGLTGTELAVACASHSGERVHLEAARSLLAKAGLGENDLACGAHWPIGEAAARALIRSGQRPTALHNNCSGKHAGMLAACVQLGLPTRGYERAEHPLQMMIARILSETCAAEISLDRMGIDGCSLPTFALPLRALAQGFARLGAGQALAPARAAAARRLFSACFAAPVLVAGEGRFDTIALRALAPDVFVKGGAEGVHCAALPELGLGIAVKIDDGAKRGTERVMSELLAALVPAARSPLATEIAGTIRNWHGIEVGRIAASPALQDAAVGVGE